MAVASDSIKSIWRPLSEIEKIEWVQEYLVSKSDGAFCPKRSDFDRDRPAGMPAMCTLLNMWGLTYVELARCLGLQPAPTGNHRSRAEAICGDCGNIVTTFRPAHVCIMGGARTLLILPLCQACATKFDEDEEFIRQMAGRAVQPQYHFGEGRPHDVHAI